MARVPVNTNLPTEFLQPQAAPVDTFVTPPRSSMRDFADALAKLDKPLQQFLDARAEKQAEEDRIRGEAAFYEDNSNDIAELVRTGKVRAQYSPAFVKGFKNAQGSVVGRQLRSDFNAAFDAWDGKNSDDPKVFDEFMGSFIREHVSSDDPEVLRGLMPHVRQLGEEGYNRYEDYRHKQTVQGSLDAHVAAANQDIDELNREGLSTEEGTNYPVVFQKIEEKRAAFVASGGDPDAFDKTMVDAMSAKILATRDPGLLAWFDQKVPGKPYTYGDSPYGSKVKLETTDSLEVIARRSASEDYQKQQREDKARTDEAHRAAIEFLSDPANVAKPVPDGILKQGEIDPTFKVHIEEWRKTLGSGFSDPRKVQDVYGMILDGGGYKAVTDAFRNGVFGRPEDLQAAYAFAKSYEDNKDRITATVTSPTADRFMKDLDIRTKGKNDWGDPITGTSNEGYEAQYDFKRLLSDWVMRNPNATPQETEEAIYKLGKGVMDRLQLPEGFEAGDDMAPPATYERPTGLGFDNPFTDGTAPAPQTPVEPAPEQPTPGEQQGQQEDIEDLLNGLTPEQKAAVEGRAKALGLSPEDFAKQYLLKGDQKSDAGPTTPDGTPVQQTSYSPEQGTEAARSSLVTSTKRGYEPDISHLQPRVVTGVSALQKAWGRDLPIVSGFRDTARNKKAGGATKSQHIHGNAVDIDVSGMSKPEQVKLLRMASEQGFTGIGVYGNSIHLDYGGRRYWGPDHHKESLPGWAREVMAEHVNRQAAMPNGQPPVFDQKTAMGFLDDAMEAMPEDTNYDGSTKITGDPMASRLGNFIGQLEANGNYNAVSGNANSTRDLGQYSVNQILAMQVRAKVLGRPSSAVGKYQLLRKTLRGLKQELGLSGDEKFTPKLQDHLFHALLIRRGYNEYRASRMSKRQFALRLSQEWASLPNPRTGRSYYAGDGFHGRTRARPSDVYAALGFTLT